jgi:twitching motility protein PilT
VISTLHTIDATETINRLLDLFPPQQQREVRTSFAGALRGIVSQRLVSRADGKGRVPAVEVLIATGRVDDRIVDPEATVEIHDVIAEGEFYGMQTFDQAPVKVVKSGPVQEEEARRASTNPHDFVLTLRGTTMRTVPSGTRNHQGPLAPPPTTTVHPRTVQLVTSPLTAQGSPRTNSSTPVEPPHSSPAAFRAAISHGWCR